MDVLKAFVSGVVVIGLVTAVGLHGTALANAAKGAGTGGATLLNSAEKPK
jgi:hypothetical protein